MTTHTIYLSRIAAAVAGLGLVLSALAPMAMAQTTTTTTTTTTTASFTRDLTIGSTGADVTALQNWLISKGHTIAAGATGYFGAQTKAALAAYQASAGITPAAGYFGPVTRAKVQTVVETPPSKPTPSKEDDKQVITEKEVREAIEDAKDAIEAAKDEIDDADSDIDNDIINDAEDLLEEAEDLVNEAEDRVWDKDYEEGMNVLKQVSEKIDEALELVEEDTDTAGVTTKIVASAEANDQDGADNDFAEFEIKIDLTAKGSNIYLSRSLATAFDFQVEDADDDAVSAGVITGLLRSSAKTTGNYYLIEEGDKEEFTIAVTFDPQASDEGEYYALQLLGVNFSDEAQAPNLEWNFSPQNKYQTNPVYIAD